MKITKLQFISDRLYVGEQGKADSNTHDIERMPGEGYVLRHKRSGKAYFVPYAFAIAEVDPNGEETADASAPDQRPAAGRVRKAKDSPPVQG